MGSAFTTKNKSIARSLKNTVTFCNGDSCCEVTALWDTGATGTCISKELAARLNLQSTGLQRMKTPSGEITANTYLVNILLPNNVPIHDIKVCDSEIGNQNIDALIGMDIISQGDFSVSTYNGETWFTFRVPSAKHTDYVEQIRYENTIGPTHGKGKRKHRK